MGVDDRTLSLLVGLGNPGRRYAGTRHNIGFMVIETLAHRWGVPLKEERKFSGNFCKVPRNGRSINLLEPTTYMNESGQSVRRALDFFKLPSDVVLVVTDDVALPFGQLRLRAQGGAGGHNGLKSIQQHLGTNNYLRLRMGVGDRSAGSLQGHVLGRFSQDEAAELETFVCQAADVVERLLVDPLSRVMEEVNQRPKKKKTAEPVQKLDTRDRELNQNAQETGQESKDDSR